MESKQKKPAPQRRQRTAAAPEEQDVIEYVVTSAQGTAGIWKPFRTLAGARRGLEKARALYPDAFITTIKGSPADRVS